mgnify:CR=1 FL=1
MLLQRRRWQLSSGFQDSSGRALGPQHHIDAADRRSAVSHARGHSRNSAAAERRLTKLRECGPGLARAGDAASVETRPHQGAACGSRVSTTIESIEAIAARESLRRDHPRSRGALSRRRVADPFGDAGRVGVRPVGRVRAPARWGLMQLMPDIACGVRRRAPVRSPREHHGGHAAPARAARSAPRQSQAGHRQLQRRADCRGALRRGAAVQRDQKLR